jgi:hypothetical protein
MATTINAATTGLVETSDGTAVLDLQTGGTTAIRVNATQAIGVGSSPSFGSAGQFLTSQGSAASPTWTTGGTGTVTSVGWTGGIVSVATATTTPAFTIAGTSGGIPYFSSGTTWASSAALTQYGAVYGGGAGGAPVSTAAGTTGQFLGANTGAAPTWQTPSGGGGKVVQVVSFSTTTDQANATNVLLNSALQATITPTSASNQILVLISQNGIGFGGAANGVRVAFRRNSTTIGDMTTAMGRSTGGADATSTMSSSICYLDSPATTSATTYGTQFASTNNSVQVYVNYASETSTITLMEIAP